MWAELDNRLPIAEIAADCIVSKMGDITAAFALSKPEIFTLGRPEYEQLHQAYVKALRIMPPTTVFVQQDTYWKDQYQAVAGKDSSYLGAANEAFFNGKPRVRQYSRIYLTLKPRRRQSVTSATSSLLRPNLVPPDTLDPNIINDFEDKLRQFARILEDTGMLYLRRLPTSELCSSTRSAGEVERYCYLLNPNEQKVIRDIDLDGEIRIGENSCVLYSLSDPAHLPGACSPFTSYDKFSSEQSSLPVGYSAALGLLLPCNHIYSIYIFLQDQKVCTRQLEAKRLRLEALSRLSRENSLSRDATDAYLNEAVSQQRQIVKFHANVMAWTDEITELPGLRSTIASAIAGMDAIPHAETVGAPQDWWAGIPGNAAELPVNDCIDSFLEQACCFLQFEDNYRSSASPFSIRFGDRLTGYPVWLDMDTEAREKGWTSNGNLFIMSGSGGGKSYLMAHLCRSYYDLGMHIVVVDVGHSYRVLCQLLGGCYFTYEETNPIRFNPFYISPGVSFDTEKKESLKALLLALWKKPEEGHHRSEYVALSNAIQAFYDHLRNTPGLFPCFDSFYEFMGGDYSKVLREQGVKDKEFDIENFLYVVRPYYRGGEFDYLLNARENLDLLRERFIVFELDNIKDHAILFPIVTLVIMEVFLSKMRGLPGVRKMIVIEEAWKAIANAGMAENIRYWVKTLRKFMGKLALVSQEIEDIMSSPIIKQAVINNSDIKILLDQSKFANRFDDIQSVLGLSDKQKAEVLSINKGHDPGPVYKDCWIGLGSAYSRVFRLETSLEEYLAYTSDQGEKLRVAEAAAAEGGWERGISHLAGRMRKGLLAVLLVFLTPAALHAQIPVLDIINLAAKKVVVAIDLKVQELQTQTIQLQVAEKEVENSMESTELGDIIGWVQAQQQLFAEYYRELWQVKAAISGYERLAQLIDEDARIVQQYHQMMAVLRQDSHFTPSELATMTGTLGSILNNTVNTFSQIRLVINAFVTQMPDAGRLAIIDQTAGQVDRNYAALQAFYQQNLLLSLERAKDQNDIAATKALYGL
jgi:conjugation system TraG family ATPase